MPYRQTSVSGFPAVALRSADIEVVAVPALGMKLTHLRRLRGREWLWRNDQIPLALPRPGASYVEAADSGGWDECFPTVGPSSLPGAPAGHRRSRTTASCGAPLVARGQAAGGLTSGVASPFGFRSRWVSSQDTGSSIGSR